MKIVEYFVVAHTNLTTVSKDVEALLHSDRGWDLHGGICVSQRHADEHSENKFLFAQAMIRRGET